MAGRPPKKASDRRDQRIVVAVSKKQLRAIKAAAKSAGLTTSSWALGVLLEAAEYDLDGDRTSLKARL